MMSTATGPSKKKSRKQIDLSCGMERLVPVAAPEDALSLITGKTFEYTDVLYVEEDAAALLVNAQGCSCKNSDDVNCSCMKAWQKSSPPSVKYCCEKCQYKRYCSNCLEGVSGDKFVLSVKLEVVRINKAKGWGVRALEIINENTFFLEYTGSLTLNNPDVNDNYVFSAKLGGNTFVIDAFQKGNVARFINHSCNPNLISFSAVYGIEKNIPHVIIKAKRCIKVGEELTIDYGDDFWNAKTETVQVCRCKSRKCKYSDPNRPLNTDENKGVRRISSSNPNVLIYKCNLCPYVADQSNSLKEHLSGHTTDYPIKCNLCTYTCKSSWYLEEHRAVHPKKKKSVLKKKKSVLKKKN